MQDRIIIDAYNNNVHIVLNSVNHLFSSFAKFAELTNFNFPETLNVSYEPNRNMFVVERKNGILVSTGDMPEIEWCRQGIDNIISAAYNDGYGQLPPGPTLQELRDMKLYETDWMITRHNDQKALNITTSLTDSQFIKLLTYRQELRDITTKYSSVDDVVWPLLDL